MTTQTRTPLNQPMGKIRKIFSWPDIDLSPRINALWVDVAQLAEQYREHKRALTALEKRLDKLETTTLRNKHDDLPIHRPVPGKPL